MTAGTSAVGPGVSHGDVPSSDSAQVALLKPSNLKRTLETGTSRTVCTAAFSSFTKDDHGFGGFGHGDLVGTTVRVEKTGDVVEGAAFDVGALLLTAVVVDGEGVVGDDGGGGGEGGEEEGGLGEHGWGWGIVIEWVGLL